VSTAAERYECVRHAILVRLKVDIEDQWPVLRALFKKELERADRLQKQLPEGMEHCTILFKECEKGHGWLTATNWVPHGCPTCQLAEERLRTIEEIAAAFDLSAVDLARRIRAWDKPTTCPFCGAQRPPATMLGSIKVISCACVGDQPVMVRR
jgi:hypothetical protein